MGAARHDVVVVGAGLAGLNAARILHRFGCDVVVLDSGDAVGGRVRTDAVDGFRLDRGFQLYNPAYPAGLRTFDAPALQLRPFGAGVELRHGGGWSLLADPVREPRGAGATVAGLLAGRAGPPWQAARFAAYAAACAVEPVPRLRARPDLPMREALRRWGVADGFLERVAVPFLSGVFADPDLRRTSRRYGDLVLRSFARGAPSLPALGMQALPEQLAADLPPGTIRTGTPVSALRGTTALTPHGEVGGRVVVVATDAPAAGALLPGLQVPDMAALTTWYYSAPAAPQHGRRHLLIGAGTGSLLCNVAVPTGAAPGYGPPGSTLIAASAVGHHDGADAAAAARGQAAALLGMDPADLAEIGRYPIRRALPVLRAGTPLRRRTEIADGVAVIGDHRDTPSIQGALVSGERGAEAAIRMLGFRG